MNKRQGIGTVAILVLLLGGGYVVAKNAKLKAQNGETQSQTAVPSDWKTYRNEKYGFEFQYPISWVVVDISSEKSGAGIKIESPTLYGIPGYEDIPVSYRILISPHSDYYSIADFGSLKFPAQSWWNAGIDKKTTDGTEEYKFGQQIISSFKFTK